MLAAQSTNETHGCMPPLCAPCSDPNQGPPRLYCFTPPNTRYGKHIYTLFTFLLPYVEQDNIYKQLSISEYAGGQYSNVISLFICPMDPSLPGGMNTTAYGGAQQWAGSSYAGNNYVFGDPDQGITYGAARIPSSFPDGTSNTIAFAEVFGTCGSGGNLSNLWGSLWADSNSIWRPGCNLGPGKAGNLVQGYPPAPLPQDNPNYFSNCDPIRPQSAHDGGLNVALADGSVRFVSSSIDAATWATVNDPRDGIYPGEW
jgi:prepilin-type processing-associated H-X9-DG protein